MRVNIRGENYRFWFRHTPTGTTAFLERGGELELRARRSYLSRKDKFCKATGRRVALTKLIRYFSREERRVIWAEYFRNHRDLKHD